MSWDPKKSLPDPMKDELVVFVLTPLGQSVGTFLWPRQCSWMLELCNGSTSGNHFAWNDTNDMDSSMGSPKVKGLDSLRPERQSSSVDYKQEG